MGGDITTLLPYAFTACRGTTLLPLAGRKTCGIQCLPQQCPPLETIRQFFFLIFRPNPTTQNLQLQLWSTRCNRGFYCRSYCLFNMFRAPLCPSSGALEYYTVVAACGISCCKNVKSNFVSFYGICVLSLIPQKTYKITFYIFTARNTTGSNHCIIL